MLLNRHTIPNALSALARASRQFFRGPIIAPDHIVRLRLDVCNQCAYLERRTGQCRQCTCFVALKTLLGTERCPRGYWVEFFSRSRHRWLHGLRKLWNK